MPARIPAVANAIKAAAQSQSVSPSVFARLIGMSEASASRILAGHQSPAPELWTRIEEALGMEPGHLNATAYPGPGASLLAGEIDELRARVSELELRVEALIAGRVTNKNFGTAAETGDTPSDPPPPQGGKATNVGEQGPHVDD